LRAATGNASAGRITRRGAEDALDRANARGWGDRRVKNDWKTVSLSDNRGPPGDVNTGEGNAG
jgi:hypothetical protein